MTRFLVPMLCLLCLGTRRKFWPVELAVLRGEAVLQLKAVVPSLAGWYDFEGEFCEATGLRTIFVRSGDLMPRRRAMQRYARLLPMILGAWFTVMWCETRSLADDVPPIWYNALQFYQKVAYQGAYDALAKIMLLCFVATLIVEYVLVYGLLGSPAKAWMELLFWVFFVNVITNPAAQLASLLIAEPGLLGSDALPWVALGVIELVVVIVEFGLLKWIFRRMYRRGFLRELVAPKRTFVVALVANLGSFPFGLVGWLVAQAVIEM